MLIGRTRCDPANAPAWAHANSESVRNLRITVQPCGEARQPVTSSARRRRRLPACPPDDVIAGTRADPVVAVRFGERVRPDTCGLRTSARSVDHRARCGGAAVRRCGGRSAGRRTVGDAGRPTTRPPPGSAGRAVIRSSRAGSVNAPVRARASSGSGRVPRIRARSTDQGAFYGSARELRAGACSTVQRAFHGSGASSGAERELRISACSPDRSVFHGSPCAMCRCGACRGGTDGFGCGSGSSCGRWGGTADAGR
ncbi:hypothetical protein EV378_1220 [Pseudonocardia endophytica]|uniref:Uncharacterized protein n=1 Tax=Pseudonocardia endophytica TaxID=401976 RepID=A0A4R1HVH9_PSEEN|nr:hypothetical protein EV378_1220 [Pseudonocardia endophytica]